MQLHASPLIQVGEITIQIQGHNRQLEQALTRSSWRFFQQQESPLPGTGRRDDDEATPTR